MKRRLGTAAVVAAIALTGGALVAPEPAGASAAPGSVFDLFDEMDRQLDDAIHKLTTGQMSVEKAGNVAGGLIKLKRQLMLGFPDPFPKRLQDTRPPPSGGEGKKKKRHKGEAAPPTAWVGYYSLLEEIDNRIAAAQRIIREHTKGTRHLVKDAVAFQLDEAKQAKKSLEKRVQDAAAAGAAIPPGLTDELFVLDGLIERLEAQARHGTHNFALLHGLAEIIEKKHAIVSEFFPPVYGIAAIDVYTHLYDLDRALHVALVATNDEQALLALQAARGFKHALASEFLLAESPVVTGGPAATPPLIKTCSGAYSGTGPGYSLEVKCTADGTGFKVVLPPGYQFTMGGFPGFICTVTTTNNPNDTLDCTGPVTAGTSYDGTVVTSPALPTGAGSGGTITPKPSGSSSATSGP